MEQEKCIKCGKELNNLIEENHNLCYKCWLKAHPQFDKKCKKCGKNLKYEEIKADWQYCTECFYKSNNR